MNVETKSASIETLSVQILALHVDGKQMTLSVFRQLPNGYVFMYDGTPHAGSCWGLVRYSIKHEGDFWLVVSYSGRLYRCLIDEDFYASKLECAEENLREAEEELQRFEEWCVAVAELDAYYKEVDEYEKGGPEPPPPKRGYPYKHEYRKYGSSHEEIRQYFLEDLQKKTECLAVAHNMRRFGESLEALPQLFIAI